jgi:hypothetical protein
MRAQDGDGGGELHTNGCFTPGERAYKNFY